MKTLFEVKKIWKGTSSSQIIIYTSFGSCTFRFAEGGEYLVFSSYRGEIRDIYVQWNTEIR